MKYRVEMRVKGAYRTIVKTYDTEAEAVERAERWRQSNGQGDYTATVKPITARDEVLLAVPEADRIRVAALANWFGNHQGGRPSDNARSAVHEYNKGRLEIWEDARAQERADIHRRECQYGPRNCGRCAEIEANWS